MAAGIIRPSARPVWGRSLTGLPATGAQLGSFSGERPLHPEALWSKKLLGLEAADKNVDQVRSVGRPQATLLQRLHELGFGDRFVVRADENAGNGRLDTDGLGAWEQTRELSQTFGIG